MPDEIQSAFLRLFIALAIPEAVRKEIGRAQSQLQRCAPPGLVRWTRPEQFHVTLKYLGDVPLEQVESVEKLTNEICAGFPALQLTANGLGFFPHERKPRVIWAGADDASGQLAELHRQLDDAMRPFAPAEKPGKFTGHVTLGRFKPGHHGSIQKLLERAAKSRGQPFGDWPVLEVEMVRSELTSQGATHTPLGRCRLAG